jgi:hypothetical protein
MRDALRRRRWQPYVVSPSARYHIRAHCDAIHGARWNPRLLQGCSAALDGGSAVIHHCVLMYPCEGRTSHVSELRVH